MLNYGNKTWPERGDRLGDTKTESASQAQAQTGPGKWRAAHITGGCPIQRQGERQELGEAQLEGLGCRLRRENYPGRSLGVNCLFLPSWRREDRGSLRSWESGWDGGV